MYINNRVSYEKCCRFFASLKDTAATEGLCDVLLKSATSLLEGAAAVDSTTPTDCAVFHTAEGTLYANNTANDSADELSRLHPNSKDYKVQILFFFSPFSNGNPFSPLFLW
jgi:hypothetical protein